MPIRRRGTQARRHPTHRVVLPPVSSEGSFEALVERALDTLPEPLRRLLDNVAVVIQDEPLPDQAVDRRGRPIALYGLYEGTPLAEWGADWVPFPNKITLFRVPLEDDFPDLDQLADEVRRTVVHELAHHAGLGEARLRELGYD
jgi:predicted Zn-dependent protease with MMP-like domain